MRTLKVRYKGVLYILPTEDLEEAQDILDMSGYEAKIEGVCNSNVDGDWDAFTKACGL